MTMKQTDCWPSGAKVTRPRSATSEVNVKKGNDEDCETDDENLCTDVSEAMIGMKDVHRMAMTK